MTELIEQGIDLRPYVTSLWNKRYWIVAFGVLGAVLGLVISFLVPSTYEATALVASTLPRERLEFDARIQTVTEPEPLKAYPDLATSDTILVQLRESVPAVQSLNMSQLRKLLSASAGSDPSIVRLTVENKDPAVAAELANRWAEIYVTRANEIYGFQGDEQLLFFEARMEEAAAQLETAEQSLIDFQKDNRFTILSNELLAAQQTQADYLAKQRQTELLLQDVESLLTQVEGGNLSDSIVIDRLSAILLQVRALGGVATTGTSPMQIQLSLEGVSDSDGAGSRDTIVQLRDMLTAQSSQIEERLITLEPEILSLQEEKLQIEVLNERLNRGLEVAEETYTTLARTVDEKRITSEDTTSGVKLASRTTVPERPSSPNVVLNAIVAGMAGVILSIAAILLAQWWRSEEASREAEGDAAARPLSVS